MRHGTLLYNLGPSYGVNIEVWNPIVQSGFLIIFSQSDPEESRRIGLGALFWNASSTEDIDSRWNSSTASGPYRVRMSMSGREQSSVQDAGLC